MYTVPNIPHLRNVRLTVEYRELMETQDQTRGWSTAQKWKQDPDISRYGGFAPRCQYYLNGSMVGEELPKPAQISRTPFPEKRVPRRGLQQVYPGDPDYVRICLEQGLEYLVNGHLSPPLVNGIHSSPISQKSMTPARSGPNGLNGTSAPSSTNGDLVNGTHNGFST